MLIGYARTSTVDQQAGFEAQLVELNTYGCERTYQEQVSAVATRTQLEAAIDMLREGDKLVVTNWIVWPVQYRIWVTCWNRSKPKVLAW